MKQKKVKVWTQAGNRVKKQKTKQNQKQEEK